MEDEPQEKLSPVQKLVDNVRECDNDRNYWMHEARNNILFAAGMGGLAIWNVLSGDSNFIGGVEGAGLIWGLGNAARDVGIARNSSAQATALRQTLAQHELSTGEIIPIYDELAAEDEQIASPRLFDQEQPSGA